MTPLIQLERIGKTYGSGPAAASALTDITLAIAPGEYVAVAGPSGCGKTTLLSLLGLLDRPTEGSYLLGGQATARFSARERARVRNLSMGFVFQSFNLIGDLSVLENVALPLRYRGTWPRQRRRAALEALERVGLSDYAEEPPAHLSGGQQQRVAVARAMVTRPPLLLADEPTGNLDSANGAAVMEFIRELHAEGAAVVMVTHDPRYAGLAEREIDLFDGRVRRDELVARSSAAGVPPGS